MPSMKIVNTPFEGLYEFQPEVFYDERGYFFESYREDLLRDLGVDVQLVQDNTSYSKRGVIRGLHLQNPPHAQAKFVRVITGKVLEVVVDIRKSSSKYKKAYSAILDSRMNNMIYIPEGFAHGFAALEDSIIHYKTNSYYNKASESGIRWDDPDLNIDWMTENPIISDKDRQLPVLGEFTSQFS
jgi:dTDP-4-dehydrorhamnose 3,5-epimerase